MANEIHVNYASANTLYAVVRDAAGNAWYVTGQTFEVWNSGGGTLDYDIAVNQTWLLISPTDGTSSGLHNPHDVTFDTSELPASGSPYSATIAISDDYASNSPQTIDVTLTIYEPVDVTPPTVSITSPSSGEEFTETPISVTGTAEDLEGIWGNSGMATCERYRFRLYQHQVCHQQSIELIFSQHLHPSRYQGS